MSPPDVLSSAVSATSPTVPPYRWSRPRSPCFSVLQLGLGAAVLHAAQTSCKALWSEDHGDFLFPGLNPSAITAPITGERVLVTH